MTGRPDADLRRGPSRRAVLAGSATAVGLAAVGGVGIGRALASEPQPPPDDPVGRAAEPFRGLHQAGVETARQAVTTFVGLDLAPGADRDALRRLLRLWTSDAERLTAGRPALADSAPDLAAGPARLTVTVGLGPEVFTKVRGLPGGRPAWLRPVPALPVDRLEARWSGGDLLLQVGADDRVAQAHALRVLLTTARSFARVRWVQAGFDRAAGAVAATTTSRNLMGQVDGTVNPVRGTDDFARVVWIDDGSAWAGGTGMVLRRIRMTLDTWDALDRTAQEQVIGRRLADGSPLTGTKETDKPDLDAVGPDGLPVIPEFAHVRRARAASPEQRFLRRGASYDDGFTADGRADVGLLFAAYAADLDRQVVPVLRAVAEKDLLNTWTTPVGSAVFAVLPGTGESGWIGEAVVG